MKHYILPLLFLTLVSCDSFLEEDPKSALPTEQAYDSVNDLFNNAVLDIYNYIGGKGDSQGLQGTGRGVFDFNSLTTDEAIMPTRGGDWYDGGFWQTLFCHTWVASTASLKDTWDYLFRVVMLCNEYLERMETYQKAHPDTYLDNYTAELRAVRAMYYFYLMDLFGRVPVIEHTGLATNEVPLSSRSQVYLYIVKELQEAWPQLAAERSNYQGTYYGRMTQPVVLFLLAKLALNAEVYMDDDWTDGKTPSGKNIYFNVDGKQVNAWKAVVAFCDKIESYGYILSPSIKDNFSPTNEISQENIFTIPMDTTKYNNWYCYFFRSRHYCHGAVLGGASENGTSATIEVLKAFGYDTEGQDPRFEDTFYAGMVYEDGVQVFEDDGKTPLQYHPWEVTLDLTGSPYEKTAGARLRKYANDPNANADGRNCNNDIVLFRFADVLLMRSEALVRDGQNGDLDLNRVRKRAEVPMRTATLETIQNERMLELSQEGWRRNDMIRFGRFTQSYTDHEPSATDRNGCSIVFPIPSDLLTMNPSWEQNPGY
jgi:hypothetical protein